MKVAYLIEPPFNHLDASGKVTGCDVELARHVLGQLGIEQIAFVETEFAQLLPGLACGDWEMTTGLFASEERRRHAHFSRPIWALTDGLLIKTEDADRLSGYRSIARSADLHLAVVRDQVQYQTAVEAGIPTTRIRIFETYERAAQAVRDGHVSAYASVAQAHVGYLRQTTAPDLAVADVPVSEKQPAFGCFGFGPGSPDLRDRVDLILEAFLGSPAHRQFMQRFGFDDDTVDRIL
ncbi:hypothetical protein So717_13460 [Roseobacter cerasinus]|uniref:Solute-binding protein family 3/N-terminal domain-containing protein n=1 Tax=Roseobacter cerasinus TaxID=2602289 RepID=A0A640VMX0_9RHOB|nr:transporter substrate-binding domain-containing protein [Roseobacter cerasinus]GFE49593.1 hypothetical protein So717_13460 [Roseobacter cerasinus]